MLIPISKACAVVGVCERTLRRWEARGIMTPARTVGNHRRYDYDALIAFRDTLRYNPAPRTKSGVAAVYARVSSHKQKEDLVRQAEFLCARATADGFVAKVYTDIGSGLNDARPGLLRLLRDGLRGRFDAAYCTYLDRIARFGTRPIVEVFRHCSIPVVAVHVPEARAFEEVLTADIIALVTSFAGKVHRRRKGQNRADPSGPAQKEGGAAQA